MRRIKLAALVLAAGALLAAPQALAAPLSAPATGAGLNTSLAEKVGWKCGPLRCVWVPNYTGRIPPRAPDLGEPLYPGCYWRRGILTRWRMICP